MARKTVPSSSPWSKTPTTLGWREPGRRAGLADEAGGEVVVVAEPGVHDLDRDGAVEPEVGGLVDAGHAAARDPRADPVAAVEQAPDQGVASSAGAEPVLGALIVTARRPSCVPDGEGSGAPSYGRGRRGDRLRRVPGVAWRAFRTAAPECTEWAHDRQHDDDSAEVDLAALVPEWLDWAEAGARLGVTPAKVRTMIRDHELAAAVPSPVPARRSRPTSSRTGWSSRACPGC